MEVFRSFPQNKQYHCKNMQLKHLHYKQYFKVLGAKCTSNYKIKTGGLICKKHFNVVVRANFRYFMFCLYPVCGFNLVFTFIVYGL